MSHLLQEGFLLRLCHHPELDAFVPRGGMRLRQSFPGRSAFDVDLVCSSPLERRALEGLIRAVLAEDRVSDGVRFDPARFRVDPVDSWGFRVIASGRVDGVSGDLIVDVRVGLPLWPPPTPEPLVASRGTGCVWMCRPETQVGRKIQVTTALGPEAWRPKDLLDLYWWLACPPPGGWALGEAVEAAFEGHLGEVRAAREVFCTDAWWTSRQARLRGRALREGGVTLEQVMASLRAGLAPILGGAR